jgi:hypothetical protein
MSLCLSLLQDFIHHPIASELLHNGEALQVSVADSISGVMCCGCMTAGQMVPNRSSRPRGPQYMAR